MDIANLRNNAFGIKADLSSVNNSGYINSKYEIASAKQWIYGIIPIPESAEYITFLNLPEELYSIHVFSYFVDEYDNRIGDGISGDKYLGTGVVTLTIPARAKSLMFTGGALYLESYNIIFNYISTLVAKNAEDIAYLKNEIDLEILIPDTVYAVVGTELNIWNDAVSLSVDSGLNSPMNYTVEWNCKKGIITSRCFRFNPTLDDVGTYDCMCSIFTSSTHSLIKSKTFSIEVVASVLSSPKRIVHFGDSLGASTASKLYENFNSKLTGEIPTMLGTRGTTPRYEAVGGYTWWHYATSGANQYRIQITSVSSVNIGDKYAFNDEEYFIREVNIVYGSGNLLLERQYGKLGTIDSVTSGSITLVTGSGDGVINFTNSSKEPNNPLWDSSLNDGVGGISFSKYRERLGLLSEEKIDAVSF